MILIDIETNETAPLCIDNLDRLTMFYIHKNKISPTKLVVSRELFRTGVILSGYIAGRRHMEDTGRIPGKSFYVIEKDLEPTEWSIV